MIKATLIVYARKVARTSGTRGKNILNHVSQNQRRVMGGDGESSLFFSGDSIVVVTTTNDDLVSFRDPNGNHVKKRCHMPQAYQLPSTPL